MVTCVYIDGFNLYHGLIRPQRMHWLDLQEFSRRLNGGTPVEKIVFCTAMVSSRPDDPEKAQRQDVYHRALAIACPAVEIVKGNFQKNKKLVPVAGCQLKPTCAMKMSVVTEKGSDVNLASRLLHGAHLGRFDRAIVVSGDSDLAEPIRLIVAEAGRPVWFRNPRNVPSAELKSVASDSQSVRPRVLAQSQLPDPVVGNSRQYRKPERWSSLPVETEKVIIGEFECPEPGCANILKSIRRRASRESVRAE